MARRGALTPELLTGLGIEKLARLVLHETERNPSFKRIVSAAVAAGRGPDAGTSTSVRPNHAAYRGELKRTHGRKAAFWNLVEGRR